VLEEIFARVAKFLAQDTTDNDLLTCLKPNSLFAERSGQRFSLQQEKYEVLTFFETKETSFFGVSKVLKLKAQHCCTCLANFYQIVVNRGSAELGWGVREECKELNRNHREICKFATRQSAAYESVIRSLSRIVSHALELKGRAANSIDQASVCHITH
jgi:hypothetical protein